MKITENKSTLARLLAKENIIVTQTSKPTAYFDVKSRTLALPNWKIKGQSVMDMLIGHEVGHALYTPEDAIEKFKAKCPGVPFDICNIVEDIRIERLVQDAYPGLPRVFTEAYNKLVEADFFQIGDKDIGSLKFADRLNLRGKIGKISDIPLTEDEELIYQKCLAAETYDEVLDICAEIAESFKEEPEEPENDEPENDEAQNDETSTDEGDSDNEGESENGESNEDETDDGSEASDGEPEDSQDDSDVDADSSSSDIKADDNAEDSESNDESDSADAAEASEKLSELVSETQEKFDSNLENQVINPKDQGYAPAMAPRRESIYDNICDYKTLIADREKAIAHNNPFIDEEVHSAFKATADELRKKTKKKASILAREFERRKAAYQYSRSTESRTGMIDVNKLHSYKLTDEVFLSKSLLADAKSHGMIFLLDYSGSMGGVITDVIEQTLNLVEFCRMVGIPYDVYSFTSAWRSSKTWLSGGSYTPAPTEIDLQDVLMIRHLSSEMNKSDFKKASDNLWMQVALKGSRTLVTAPYEELGGTPLDAALTAMYTLVKDFIAKNKVQKTMFVTLTDGDSQNFKFDEPGTGWNYAPKVNLKTSDKSFLISRGHTTRDLIEMIGSIPTVTTMGFYLPQNKRELNRQITMISGYNSKTKTKLMKNHKKDGHIEVSNRKGYDTYYILGAVSIDDSEFKVKDINDDIATSKRAQTQLAKQFASHNSGNKKSRVLMNSIATKVA